MTYISYEEKEDISAELKVSKAGLFNAEGNFAKSLEKMSRERNVLIQSLQRGGIDSADTVQHLTAEQLIKRATSFPSVAKEAPVPYAALLVDYETLDMPEVSLVDLQNAREVLRQLAFTRDQLVTMLNDVNYVLTHQSEFGNLTRSRVMDLNTAKDDIAKAINEIANAASGCSNDIADCRLPENLDLPQFDLELPNRKGSGKGPFRLEIELVKAPDLELASKPQKPKTLTESDILAFKVEEKTNKHFADQSALSELIDKAVVPNL